MFHKSPFVYLLLPTDFGIWRHESRVDWERVAAQPGSASVPLLLHGVSGGRANAGSSNEEGPKEPLKDGGQLPSVCILVVA